jgi:CHAD domain-containing protein
VARTAAEVLTASIRAQVGVILDAPAAVRSGAFDAVHRSRRGIVRLRGLLREFPQCFTAEAAALEVELAEWGRVLGDARDAGVQRDRFAELSAAVEPTASAAVGKGLGTLDETLRRRHEVAHGHVLTALAGEEWEALADRLARLAEQPPLKGKTRHRARPTLEPALDKAARRVRRRTQAIREDEDDAVHRLRKAARRARFTAEVLASFGSGRRSKDANRAARRYHALQDILGVAHDAEVLCGTLGELRSPATADAVDLCLAVERLRHANSLAASRSMLQGLQ